MSDQDFDEVARVLTQAADVWFDQELHLALQKLEAEARRARREEITVRATPLHEVL
jgi:hypothetical protein